MLFSSTIHLILVSILVPTKSHFLFNTVIVAYSSTMLTYGCCQDIDLVHISHIRISINCMWQGSLFKHEKFVRWWNWIIGWCSWSFILQLLRVQNLNSCLHSQQCIYINGKNSDQLKAILTIIQHKNQFQFSLITRFRTIDTNRNIIFYYI